MLKIILAIKLIVSKKLIDMNRLMIKILLEIKDIFHKSANKKINKKIKENISNDNIYL